MKKYGNSLRILFLCIAGVFCVMLFTSEEAGQRYFCGMVLEISDQYFLVEPDEGEEERKSADRITVPTNVISAEGVPEVKVGDEIRIVYDGEIMESYPARLSTGFAIDRADETVLHGAGVHTVRLYERDPKKPCPGRRVRPRSSGQGFLLFVKRVRRTGPANSWNLQLNLPEHRVPPSGLPLRRI